LLLSAPPVEYGVVESPVDSGSVYKHPFKRARTTGTYLAAATVGTESSVSDNAFDPRLQLWVAACVAAAGDRRSAESTANRLTLVNPNTKGDQTWLAFPASRTSP
jgi:uncharacterized protein (DUF2236 family)